MTFPVCIYEDNLFPQLYPLTLTRPVFDLRCGILTLKEKIAKHFSNNPLILYCRDYLKDFIQIENPHAQINKINAESCLFINGRLVADTALLTAFNNEQERLILKKNQIIAAFLKGENISKFVESVEHGLELDRFPRIEKMDIENANMIHYPWDLIHLNPGEIEKDFHNLSGKGAIKGVVSRNAILENKSQIHIGNQSVVNPGVVLDASNGPIYIGENVTIMSNAVIDGPVFIGNHSTIKIAAKIYEGTSIGEVCKVGGEVEESIIHSYSNKQHDGFLGHAYLGQWVNLGADTNNSDLKNNYGSVKVLINGELIDSGSMFVGLFMGDHSKSGINTMFNTGTVVGAMCNVFGSDFPPKYLPSFSWGGANSVVEHDFTKAIDTARQVMARREKCFTAEYEMIFKHLFDSTRDERKRFLKKINRTRG